MTEPQQPDPAPQEDRGTQWFTPETPTGGPAAVQPGPSGPSGPAGPDGPDGPTGPTSRPEVLTSGEGPGRGRRVLAGVALATGLVAGGALVASAASTTTPAPSSPSAPSEDGGDGSDDAADGRGRFGGGPMGHGRHGGMKDGLGLRGALHGEMTVKKSDGTYEKLAVQNGTVTAVSPTSITVKSEDGYSATYVVTEGTLVNATRDGISDVENGHAVHVVATVDGSAKTAVRIGDRTLVKDVRGERGGEDPGSGGATSSSSGSATSGA